MHSGLELYGLRKDHTEFPSRSAFRPSNRRQSPRRQRHSRHQRSKRPRGAGAPQERGNRRARSGSQPVEERVLVNMSQMSSGCCLMRSSVSPKLTARREGGAVAADHKEYLGDILTSSRHLLQLINDVLDLSKVESGRRHGADRHEPAHRGRCGISSAPSRPGSRSRSVLQFWTHRLLKRTPAKLKQVLYNYLSNALKFSPDGGRVESARLRRRAGSLSDRGRRSGDRYPRGGPRPSLHRVSAAPARGWQRSTVVVSGLL